MNFMIKWQKKLQFLQINKMISHTIFQDQRLFKAAIFFGKEESPQHAFELGLGENYTLTVAYRRDFSSSTGMPEPGDDPHRGAESAACQ